MPKPVSEWLQEIDEGLSTLEGVEDGLSNLADAFFETGNAHTAEALLKFQRKIYQAKDQIATALHVHLNYEFDQSINSMGDCLKSILERIKEDA